MWCEQNGRSCLSRHRRSHASVAAVTPRSIYWGRGGVGWGGRDGGPRAFPVRTSFMDTAPDASPDASPAPDAALRRGPGSVPEPSRTHRASTPRATTTIAAATAATPAAAVAVADV